MKEINRITTGTWKFISLVATIVLLCLPAPMTHAATRAWDGSASGFWTNAANWVGSIAPTHGDGLVFPAGPARIVTTNTAGAPSNFLSFAISGDLYVLHGPTLTITDGVFNVTSFTTNVIAAGLRIGDNAEITNAGRSLLILNSNVNLNTRTLTVSGAGDVEIDGGFIGSGTLVKTGSVISL